MNGIELQEFAEELDSQEMLFSNSLSIIAKRFLSKVFNENIFLKEYEYIREKFISQLGDEHSAEIPIDEEGFYSFVAIQEMGITKEPRKIMIELFLEARSDLEEIEIRLKDIDCQKSRIEESVTGTILSQEKKYEIEKLKYYADKNRVAKEEIENFIIFHIKKYAFNECTVIETIFPRLFRSGPYPYSKRGVFNTRQNCKVENFSIFYIKFLEMTPQEYREKIVPIQYSQEEVAKIGKAYIQEHDLINFLRSVIEKNHILYKRKELLEKLIEHFKNDDLLSFVYMAPPQIEGIFHDYCIEIGISPDSIEFASLNEKLRLLNKKNYIHLLYEYYAFHFPKLRNEIAHGRILQGNISNQAVFLFLDIIPVCNMMMSESLPINKSISLINGIEAESTEDLYEWIDFIDITHDPFYQLEDHIRNVLAMFHSVAFWNSIQNIFDNSGSEGLVELQRRITILKKKEIEKDKCVNMLRALSTKLQQYNESIQARVSGLGVK